MQAFILAIVKWIIGAIFGREPIKPTEADKSADGLGLSDADRM